MLIALFGSSGQLGSELVKILSQGPDELREFDIDELDLTDFKAVHGALTELRPDMIINCTAYNRVDDASTNQLEAMKLNHQAVEILARISDSLGATIVHFSTDYVFNGAKTTPYTENDPPAPLSTYGISKFLGENSIRKVTENHYIIRTCGLFGKGGSVHKGTNFVESIIKKASLVPELKVIGDQIMAPTYAKDLAELSNKIIRTHKNGTYHVTNSGSCSWHGFASEIVLQAGLSAKVLPIPSSEYPQVAIRPRYSVMESVNLEKAGLQPLRHWKKALAEYIKNR